jgi:hypothetical protein
MPWCTFIASHPPKTGRSRFLVLHLQILQFGLDLTGLYSSKIPWRHTEGIEIEFHAMSNMAEWLASWSDRIYPADKREILVWSWTRPWLTTDVTSPMQTTGPLHQVLCFPTACDTFLLITNPAHYLQDVDCVLLIYSSSQLWNVRPLWFENEHYNSLLRTCPNKVMCSYEIWYLEGPGAWGGRDFHWNLSSEFHVIAAFQEAQIKLYHIFMDSACNTK